MEEFDIYGISGLYDELFAPNLADLSTTPITLDAPDGLSRLNGLFWATLLDASSIRDAIVMLQAQHRHLPCHSPQYIAILTDPDLFIQRAQAAAKELVNQGIDQISFFGHVETLSILCKLYSDFVFTPHSLMLTDGILQNELDAQTLIADCLTNRNPYLPFLRQHAFPLLEAQHPQLIWLHGPPRMATMAIACFARSLLPNAHICIVDHSSEYYSLNKITALLMRNDALFSVIDSIVLDDTTSTKQLLRRALSDSVPLSMVPNIMFSDRSSGTIHQTDYAPCAPVRFIDTLTTRPRSLCSGPRVIDPSELVDARLLPDTACAWHQCAFCGINHKYKSRRPAPELMADKIKAISALVRNGKHFFWFIDEAIPPESLRAFAQGLLDADIHIIWQVRARLSERFDETLCALLAQAGLREIRFGLESGSQRVLERMNKFDGTLDFELVKRIANDFHHVGISAHFPIIIGFPGETPADRAQTYRLLAQLKEESPSVTFNINLLGLDIASDLYQHSLDFDIRSTALPCAPRHFVGNIINQWEDEYGPFQTQILSEEQTRVMRELLYPWMPASSLTPPHIFYRLSETIRNTLIWKSQLPVSLELPRTLPHGKLLIRAKDSLLCPTNGLVHAQLLWYNVQRHSFVIGNKMMSDLFMAFAAPADPSAISESVARAHRVSRSEVAELILRLFRVGILSVEAVSP